MASVLVVFLMLWGISYFHNSDYVVLYFIVSIAILAVNLYCFFFILKKNVSICQIAVLIIALGTIYNYILPACTVPDEDYHFANTYKISNLIIYGEALKDQDNTMQMRSDIVESLSREYHANGLAEYYKDFFNRQIGQDISFENAEVVRMSPSFYQYALTGIIISLCRLMKMGAHILLFTGREFNLFIFTGLISFSIKAFPQMKNSLASVSLFPMTLILAASFSYDSIIISSIVLLFAMIMKCITSSEHLSTRRIVIISLLYILVIPIKPIYCPIILLLFCIDKLKFVRPLYKYIWIVLVCITTVCAIGLINGDRTKFYITRQYSSSEASQGKSTKEVFPSSNENNEDQDAQMWTTNDVWSKPLEFIGIMFRTLLGKPNQTFMNIFGYYFGWFVYEIPITIACIFPIIFASSIYADSSLGSDKIERIVYAIIIIAIFFLVLLAMLLAETPYGAETISGAQGRYFIPVMPVVAAFFNRRKNANRGSISSKLITISSMANSLVILYLLNDILLN